MKKNLFIILILLSLCSVANAQLKEHDNLLGPSLGFWTAPNAPTFGLNFEHQMEQLGDVATISLGALMRYSSYKDNPSPYYYNYNYLTLGMQSNLNFNNIGDGKFVPFVGLVLGYNYINTSYVSPNGTVYAAAQYSSGFWLWGQAGMRYFFSPRVAGALRFGAGNFNFNVIELGIDFKL
jgi:hypothetical protein